jgi:hypothetical protein
MAKAPDQQTTTQTVAPPKFLQPYLKDAVGEASRLYHGQGPQYYQGNQSVEFSPQTLQALQMQQQRAMQGSDVNRAAQGNIQSTLNGDYLYGGQGFNAAFDAASRRINPMVDSSFATHGRTGSGLADVAKTQALSDAFASQYGQERNNQMQAAQMAPGLANQDYIDYQKLADVGGAYEGLNQKRLNEDINRFNFTQNQPMDRLNQYLQMLSGAYPGSSSTSSQPLYQNKGAGVLGGALAGAQLGSSIFGGPLGGAIGGGLLGLM